jgi:hypothetical protein
MLRLLRDRRDRHRKVMDINLIMLRPQSRGGLYRLLLPRHRHCWARDMDTDMVLHLDSRHVPRVSTTAAADTAWAE